MSGPASRSLVDFICVRKIAGKDVRFCSSPYPISSIAWLVADDFCTSLRLSTEGRRMVSALLRYSQLIPYSSAYELAQAAVAEGLVPASAVEDLVQAAAFAFETAFGRPDQTSSDQIFRELAASWEAEKAVSLVLSRRAFLQ